MALASDLLELLAGRVLSEAGAVFLSVAPTKMVTDWFRGRKIAFALGIALVALSMFANIFDRAGAMYRTAAVSGCSIAVGCRSLSIA
jgi:hypothetical protein